MTKEEHIKIVTERSDSTSSVAFNVLPTRIFAYYPSRYRLSPAAVAAVIDFAI